MSLRRRLFIRILLPVATVYLVLGLLGARQVRSTLISNLDDDLVLTSRNSAELLGRLTTDEIADLSPRSPDGTGTLFALADVASGSVFVTPSMRFGVEDPPPPDDAFEVTKLVSRLDEPFTIASQDGSLEYRAVAQRIDGGRLGIVAEPIDRITRIYRRLLVGIATTGLLVMGALAVVLYLTLRAGLRPIDGFIAATNRIAGGDLSERIELADTDPEFERIASATNHMLDQVEAGFERQHNARQRLNQLITGVAHEMRTPLAGIRGTVDMHGMGMFVEPGTADGAFEQIDHHSERMVEMVDDLLVIARAENTAVQHNATPTAGERSADLADVVLREVAALRAEHPSRSIEVCVETQHAHASADENSVAVALRAVLRNAMRHTPEDASVKVAVRPGADPAWIQVEVRDSGPGMAVDVADQVFDPFFRADPSRARSSGGTGLGLTIARSTCESLGGFIGLETQPGEGATFVISLPRPSPHASA